MGRIENLKNFEKGKSGNPNGRPKGSKNRSTVFKKLLSVKILFDNPAIHGGEQMKGTIEEGIAAAQIKKALDGDLYAFREIMDSVYGKIPQAIEAKEATPDPNLKPLSTPWILFDPATGQEEDLEIGGAS